MNDWDCPAPEHVQRAIEIRQTVRNVAFVSSWPAAAIAAVASALALVIGIAAHRAGVDTVLFYLLLLAALGLPVIFSQWITRKILHTGSPRFSTRSTAMELPWWGFIVAAIVIIPVSYFLAGGKEMPTVVTAVWLWIGTVSIAGGWIAKQWDKILSGALFLVCGALYSRAYPEGGNLYDVFVFSISFAAIAEAILAYWARRKWTQDSARFKSILT